MWPFFIRIFPRPYLTSMVASTAPIWCKYCGKKFHSRNKKFMILFDPRSWPLLASDIRFNCLISMCRDDFKSFVEICFEEFGDRVKHWITLNEPYFYSTSTTYPLTAAQNLLLAHAAAVKLYKTNYQVQHWRTINLIFFCFPLYACYNLLII